MAIGDHPKKSVFIVASKGSRIRAGAPSDLHATFHSQFGRLQIAPVEITTLEITIVEIASLSHLGIIEDRRKLEVDDAKTAVGGSIGDVAEKGVIVTHAKGLEFREPLLDPLLTHVLDPRAAIARDDLERLRIRSEQSRDERASPDLEMLQNAALVLEAFLCIRTEKLLMHSSVIPNTHQCTLGILGF